ncbi:MAG: hypothetical protein R2857_15730 [Vampirovibrionales bacterium]
METIDITGARTHNLKNVDLTIPRNRLVVFTGVSGSGKSSLAFDTIYAEGQRRYIESMSSYARQFVDQLAKPPVEHIAGLSPTIAIDQKTASRSPRSTVGTVTEITDYLRLLYAKVGTPHDPETGQPLTRQSMDSLTDRILAYPPKTKLQLMAPVVRGRKGEYNALFAQLRKEGYSRVQVDGDMLRLDELNEDFRLKKTVTHDIACGHRPHCHTRNRRGHPRSGGSGH